MLCFRVIFWGVVFFFWMIPFFFLVGIIGRIAGFRPGSPPGSVEKVFGWFGIVVLSGILLGMCLVAGLIDFTVATVAERGGPGVIRNNEPPNDRPPPNQRPNIQQTPRPKVIPAEWVDAKMMKAFLSDLPEFDAHVGFGNFGKKGKLGYHVLNRDDIRVKGKLSPHGISMHPPTLGHSSVKYRLDRAYKLFVADAGLTDFENASILPQTAATFCVLGDGQLLWMSGPIGRPAATLPCRLSVEGVNVLELQVHCPGGFSHVRGVWLEPHLLK